jgi:hypothetical protein
MSTNNASIWLNLKRVERWPTNKLTEERAFRLTTQHRRISKNKEQQPNYWHHQWSMQEPTPSSKVMKEIDIPHHDCSPNYFWNELCESVAIFTNPQILFFLEWSTSNCVDGPECNSQFLAIVIDMKTTFLLTCHALKIQFKAHIPHHNMSCDNRFSSAQISII